MSGIEVNLNDEPMTRYVYGMDEPMTRYKDDISMTGYMDDISMTRYMDDIYYGNGKVLCICSEETARHTKCYLLTATYHLPSTIYYLPSSIYYLLPTTNIQPPCICNHRMT